MANARMRVANIIEEGKLGGPQVRMVRVAAALKGQVETVIIMPGENSAGFQQLCLAAGIDVIALPLSRITKEWRVALRYVVFFPYEIWRIRRILKRGRFDLIHASGGSWQIKAVLAARLAGIPSVWHLNDTQMPGWIRYIFSRLSPLANGFIYTSVRTKDYYSSLVPVDMPDAIIEPPVDPAMLDQEASLPDEEKMISNNAPLVIGTVANVNPIKGLETLISAVGKLHCQRQPIRVTVVGPIHSNQRVYFKKLLDMAQRVSNVRIEFVGGRRDIRPLVQLMDIYVCSSKSESWGMSLFEAMAMGKPVVTTDIGDVSLIVQDGEDGFIVPVGSEVEMADRVGRLINDPGMRARMGLRAREKARKFTPDRIAGKTSAFYHRILEARKAP